MERKGKGMACTGDGDSDRNSASPALSSGGEAKKAKEPKVSKSHIEIQMENEKTRYWIRKRNGRIYDEKIKNLITTTDNGATLLKHEIVESEGRLAAIKLGKSLQEVIPKHSNEFFLTDKEKYFLGDKRALRRQEKAMMKPPKTKTDVYSESGHADLAKEF